MIYTIAAFLEIRWVGSGKIRIGEYIIYYNRRESNHNFSTGFLKQKYYEPCPCESEFNSITALLI